VRIDGRRLRLQRVYLRSRAADATERARQTLIHATAVMNEVTAAPWASPPTARDLEREIDSLRTAMASRATIERAKGIIMSSMRVGPDRAFELLVQQSQHENRKLREVAADLVEDTARRPPTNG
jgi:AmiR/NasT family two-component response regulator